jgi:hypothetical protein
LRTEKIPDFALVILEMRLHELFAQAGLKLPILLISASQVAYNDWDEPLVPAENEILISYVFCVMKHYECHFYCTF